MKERIKGVYLVTENYGEGHLELSRAALKAGVRMIQLRDKEMDNKNLIKLAISIRELCKEHDALFIINDRPEVAFTSKADGVHIGQSDMSVRKSRKIVGSNAIIGISVSSVEQALEAEKEGVDYVAVSPVFFTSTKKDAGAGLGLDMLSKICHSSNVPVVAIGGINKSNIVEVLRTGVDAVAVVSAITRADNPEKAAEELVNIFNSFKSQVKVV